MDLITQAVLGAAVGSAGWREKLGPGAVWTGMIFGLLPDADVLSGLWGPWAELVHHRGFTHSLFFAPLIAPPAGLLLWWASKKKAHPLSWMHCIFWALLTHPLLDVFTTYGTQLLAPWSDRRFALDGVSIIDPLYTLPLLFALILARIWRKTPKRGMRVTALALLLTTGYLGLGYWVATQAKERASAQLLEEDHIPMRVRAMPTFANLLVWRVIAQDERGDLRAGLLAMNHAEQPVRFATHEQPESPLIERALFDRRAQLFQWFSDEWLAYEIDESQENTTVYMYDFRYGGVRDPLAPMWGAEAHFSPGGELLTVERVNYRARGAMDVRDELGALWQLIRTGRAE